MTAVRVESQGPVTTVVLHRPDVRNAVDRPTAQLLADAFRRFDADPQAKVAVLYGDGGTFCAGADLKAAAAVHPEPLDDARDRLREAESRDASRPNRVEPDGDGPMGPSRLALSKPVIAAISGYAVAGGLELAAWCDLRVAEADAVLGVFCRRFGVPLIDGGTVRLPRLIGLSRAMDLILTGRAVRADEALSMGLVNRVVPRGQARAEAEKLAHELAAFPQECMKADRLSAYEQFGLSIPNALAVEFERGRPLIETESIPGARRFAAGEGRHGQ